MFNLTSPLIPIVLKIGAVLAVVFGLIGLGYYQGNKVAKVEAKEFEILAIQCQKRAQEREVELVQEALKRQQETLEIEKRLTARINEEIAKNGKISKALEEEIKKQKIITKRVIEYVTKEIEKPVYRECVIPPSGVSTLNRTARDYNATRANNSSGKESDTTKSSGQVR